MRARNSKFPQGFVFFGQRVTCASEIFRAAEPAPVASLKQFQHRLWRLVANGELTEQRVRDALSLTPDEYKKAYGVRQTRLKLDGVVIRLDHCYEQSNTKAVNYSTFWQRVKSVKRRRLLNQDSLQAALNFSESDWISHFGGGRHRTVTYIGEAYPAFSGIEFRSISSFLKTIGRYGDRTAIWARLKAGWQLDAAVSVPIVVESGRLGLIYQLTRISTGQIYVGLTVGSIEQRWAFHVRAALAGASTRLAKAIRNDGPDGFTHCVLEDRIEGSTLLSQRECHWVEHLKARESTGLNTAVAGGRGGSKGKPITVEGETFNSHEAAAQILAKRHGIASHVMLRRLCNGLPISGKARRESKHPEAGSNLFRRWLALNRRTKDVDARWVSDYDQFKRDVSPVDLDKELTRANPSLPWGPDNFEWVTAKDIIHRRHGMKTVVNGKTFPTLKALAAEYGIGLSTLKNRIRVQKMSPEDAVEKPLSVTSFRHAKATIQSIEGHTFRSKRQAILWLMSERGISEHAAKEKLKKIVAAK